VYVRYIYQQLSAIQAKVSLFLVVKNVNILSRKYSGPQKYLERREGGMGEGKRGRGWGCKEIGGIYISDQQENHPAENQRTENPTCNGETIYCIHIKRIQGTQTMF
jgi:hypothetical protein